MKAVVQAEKTGCGIAAFAALAGISYADAKEVANSLGVHAEDEALWSDSQYVRRLLSQAGIATTAGKVPFADWMSLPDRALLAIKWHEHKGRPYWHWVVFVREGEKSFVLDSKKDLKSNIRTDFGRMKPRWYIEVIS